jgi:hypothetical protein
LFNLLFNCVKFMVLRLLFFLCSLSANIDKLWCFCWLNYILVISSCIF